jgi:hypothetical protein
MITVLLFEMEISNLERRVAAHFVIRGLIFRSEGNEHRSVQGFHWSFGLAQHEQRPYQVQKDGDNVDIGFAYEYSFRLG